MKKSIFIFCSLFLFFTAQATIMHVQSEALGINQKVDGTYDHIEITNIVHYDNSEYAGYFIIYADGDDFSSMENIHIKDSRNITPEEAQKFMQTDAFIDAKNATLALFHFRLENKLGEMTAAPLDGSGKFEINFKNAVEGVYTITITGRANGNLLEKKVSLKNGDNTKVFAIVPDPTNLDGEYQVKVVGEEMGYQNFLRLTKRSF